MRESKEKKKGFFERHFTKGDRKKMKICECVGLFSLFLMPVITPIALWVWIFLFWSGYKK